MADEQAIPFIDRLVVKNYGCVKDVSVALTPFHAFIGPNDSGKSTLLRAMHRVARATVALDGERGARMAVFADPTPIAFDTSIELRSGGASLGIDGRSVNEGKILVASTLAERPFVIVGSKERSASERDDSFSVRQWLTRGSRLLRLDPREIQEPSKLVTSSQIDGIPSDNGRGIASLLEHIRDHDDAGFRSIQASVCRLFSNVSTFRLRTVEGGLKAFEVQLLDDSTVAAPAMSEGLRYYIAFAALRFAVPTALLLVEEPENGLHPSRIAEVVSVLRETSRHTQVIVATHSPLVINAMEPHEVTLVTRDPVLGTRTRPLGETANFKERSAVYALGELWLSYADGETEAELVSPASAAE